MEEGGVQEKGSTRGAMSLHELASDEGMDVQPDGGNARREAVRDWT